MANPVIYRLDPEVMNDLIAYRQNEYQLRSALILSSEILDDIQSGELWLDNYPSDHPDRAQVQNDLSLLRHNLSENAIEMQTIRQEANLQRYNLAHWVNHVSNFRSSFPHCFGCETVREIEAIHTLKNRTVYWPDDYVFRVALLPPPPHAHFQQLRARARDLSLEVVILPL